MTLPDDEPTGRSFATESAWQFMVALGVVLVLAAVALIVLAVAGVNIL